MQSVDEQVLALWRDVFERPDIRENDDFFELGGHSLLVMRMIVGAEDAFGVRISLREFFGQPTPRHMAELVRTSAEPDDDPGFDLDGEPFPADPSDFPRSPR